MDNAVYNSIITYSMPSHSLKSSPSQKRITSIGLWQFKNVRFDDSIQLLISFTQADKKLLHRAGKTDFKQHDVYVFLSFSRCQQIHLRLTEHGLRQYPDPPLQLL